MVALVSRSAWSWSSQLPESPSLYCTLYSVMSAPFSAGLVHETSSWPSPAFTVNALGASGRWGFGAPSALSDQSLLPASLVARTRTW